MQPPHKSQIQPIDSLTPFLGGKWWILGRVTDRSDVRTWNKPTSQGKLLSFTIIDESSAIRATLFNDAVDLFEPRLVNKNIYYFSGGQVKNANRKFSNVNNDYEITFDRTAEIIPCIERPPANVPTHRYNFVPIDLLRQREVGSVVDLLAVVLSVSDVTSITQRSTGKELTKRAVKIADMTAAVELTCWNDEARAWSFTPGTIVAFKQLKIGSFDGVTVSTTFQTQMETNVSDIADVRKLSDWYVATKGAGVESLSSLGLGAGTVSENNRGRMYLDQIESEGVGRGAKPDYVDVRCAPIYIKQDSQWYDACPTCHKKVTPEGANGDRYRCEKCDAIVTPTQRYLISIQVTDNVSQQWLTLFDESGVEFFGMTASELKAKAEADETIISRLAQARMNRPVLLRLRVKEENSSNALTGESSDRLRMSVVRITEFMSLAGADEEKRRKLAENLKAECNDIIECIDAY